MISWQVNTLSTTAVQVLNKERVDEKVHVGTVQELQSFNRSLDKIHNLYLSKHMISPTVFSLTG